MINYIKLILMSLKYYYFHYKDIDEKVIRDWVDNVLEKFNIEINCEGVFSADRFVIMANHESYFDILALYKCCQHRLMWIAKKELFGMPVISRVLKSIDSVGVERGNERSEMVAVLKVINSFRDGGLVIFPQGTRKSKNSFKRGGVVIAKKKGLPIFPVKISGSAGVLPVGKPIFRTNAVVSVSIFEGIDTSKFTSEEIETMVREKIHV